MKTRTQQVIEDAHILHGPGPLKTPLEFVRRRVYAYLWPNYNWTKTRVERKC